MNILKISKVSLLAAAISSATAVWAETNQPTDPAQTVAPTTPMEERSNQDAIDGQFNNPALNNTQSELSQDVPGQSDHVGIVAFERNSAELDENAESTLSNIARELDKQKSVELTVEVSGAVQLNSDDNLTAGESSIEQTGEMAQSQNDRVESDTNIQEPSQPSLQITQNRADEIKSFLEKEGIEVKDMSVKEAHDFGDTVVQNPAQDDALNNQPSVQGESLQGESQENAMERAQKVRIVIMEDLSSEPLSAL